MVILVLALEIPLLILCDKFKDSLSISRIFIAAPGEGDYMEVWQKVED